MLLLEMNQVAEMVEKAERRIAEALSRIEAEWEKRQGRAEREWIERQTRLETQWQQSHVTLAAERKEFEARIRALEDLKMSGKGAWGILAWVIGVVVTISCTVIAYTAVDEIRATRAQIWAAPRGGTKP